MSQPVTIDGHSYQIGKMNALTQFHVVRRLAPMMSVVGLGLEQIQQLYADGGFAQILGPVTKALSEMSDEDTNYIIFSCLGVVGRAQSDGRFAPVVAGDRFMFQDLHMVLMVRLVVEVIKENYSGFFMGLGEDKS